MLFSFNLDKTLKKLKKIEDKTRKNTNDYTYLIFNILNENLYFKNELKIHYNEKVNPYIVFTYSVAYSKTVKVFIWLTYDVSRSKYIINMSLDKSAIMYDNNGSIIWKEYLDLDDINKNLTYMKNTINNHYRFMCLYLDYKNTNTSYDPLKVPAEMEKSVLHLLASIRDIEDYRIDKKYERIVVDLYVLDTEFTLYFYYNQLQLVLYKKHKMIPIFKSDVLLFKDENRFWEKIRKYGKK